jgi:pimeloyl-ACP methyl ester carboxylesterase
MAVREGVLAGGLPYLADGGGPPLVVLPGLSGDNADPSGRERRMNLRLFRSMTRSFTVYVVNRRPGLLPGSTLGDLAGHYAEAIADKFGEPVSAVGVSTGGSIAQLLAAEHPQSIDRLVLLGSACRLSPYGRQVQQRLADLAAAGNPRRAWAATGPAMAASTAGGRLTTVLLWLTAGRMNPRDANDLVITIAAEDVFDAAPQLPRIIASTLVIGGARDRFYSPELFRETARSIPAARLRLYSGKGHFGTIASRTSIAEALSFLSDAGS